MSSVRSRSARNRQRHGIDAEVQVFAQLALAERRIEVDVGRADQPEVRLNHAAAAHRAELAVLQHAKQLDLQAGRHLADFVQQQGAAVGQLHQTGLVGHRAGERAALVAEQLGFDQLARQRRAVDLDERAFLPLTVLVNGARHELFARAVLAVDQHAGVGRRHRFDEVEQLPHLVAARDDVREARVVAQLFFQPLVFGRELELLGGLVEHDEQHVGVDRLLDEAEGAGLHRLDRLRHAAVAGDHDDLRLRAGLLEIAQQVDAVGIGQHQVHQDDFRPPRPENLPSLRSIRRRPGQVPAGLDQQFQEISGIPVVVDDRVPRVAILVTLPALFVLIKLHYVVESILFLH